MDFEDMYLYFISPYTKKACTVSGKVCCKQEFDLCAVFISNMIEFGNNEIVSKIVAATSEITCISPSATMFVLSIHVTFFILRFYAKI